MRACFATNDDRFDPKLAVQAKGKLLAKSTKRYAAYDQQLALVLIDYNAGAGAAQQILTRAGTNPTWEQLKNVIQNDVTINYGVANPAKDEVVQYVERITQQIIPDGEASTAFGRERVGKYTLHFSV